MFIARTYDEHLALLEPMLPAAVRGRGPQPSQPSGLPRWVIRGNQVFATIDALAAEPGRRVYHVSWSAAPGRRPLSRAAVEAGWFPPEARGATAYSRHQMPDGIWRHDLLWRMPTA